jgi:hypothetical protein
MHCAKRERVRVRKAGDPLSHSLNERKRAVDLAQRPQHEREIGHGGHARVHPEAKGQIVVAARLEQRERALQMGSRFKIFAREVVGNP